MAGLLAYPDAIAFPFRTW